MKVKPYVKLSIKGITTLLNWRNDELKVIPINDITKPNFWEGIKEGYIGALNAMLNIDEEFYYKSLTYKEYKKYVEYSKDGDDTNE